MGRMGTLRSVWEAKSVIGVVDFDMGRLKCNRIARFYSSAAKRRRIQPYIEVSMGGQKCDMGSLICLVDRSID